MTTLYVDKDRGSSGRGAWRGHVGTGGGAAACL